MEPVNAPMSRGLRTVRGAVGAGFATAIAAASHAVAGGAITWLAVLATWLIALPICVALAGRIASAWRLSLGVFVSQFIFHWSFSGLGLASGANGSRINTHPGSHAHHADESLLQPAVTALSLPGFTPGSMLSTAPHVTVAAGFESGVLGVSSLWATEFFMWLAHALATVGTVLFLRRSDQAIVVLRSVLQTAYQIPVFIQLPAIAVRRRWQTSTSLHTFRAVPSCGVRGPPGATQFSAA